MYSALIIKNHVILVVFIATPDPRIERESIDGSKASPTYDYCTSVIWNCKYDL
jgi:hypothetical protein